MRPNGTSSRAAWVTIAAAFCISCIGAFYSSQGDLASSRFATVYGLTHYGTWYIDQPDNPFTPDTIDKVVVRGDAANGITRGGRMISSKPPVMPIVMAAVYLAAHAIAGWDLTSPADVDALRPDHDAGIDRFYRMSFAEDARGARSRTRQNCF